MTLPNVADVKIIAGEVMNAQEQAQLTTNPEGQVPGAGVRTIGCDGLRINQVDDVMSINSLHL